MRILQHSEGASPQDERRGALLIAKPASPNAALAAALFLAHETLVEMDVPTRQSYVMAVVKPAERTCASA